MSIGLIAIVLMIFGVFMFFFMPPLWGVVAILVGGVMLFLSIKGDKG